MFKRKKSGAGSTASPAAPRGRGREASAAFRNPLARRFDGGAEPDTVDLAEPGRFHAPREAVVDEPDTRAAGSDRGAGTADSRAAVVTREAATGKFYLQPGDGAVEVRLNGHPVAAPTELRRGDRLEIGGDTFEFLS